MEAGCHNHSYLDGMKDRPSIEAVLTLSMLRASNAVQLSSKLSSNAYECPKDNILYKSLISAKVSRSIFG